MRFAIFALLGIAASALSMHDIDQEYDMAEVMDNAENPETAFD